MTLRRTHLLVLTSLVVAITGCGLSEGTDDQADGEVEVSASEAALTVEVHDDYFAPDDDDVAVGDTVAWDFSTAGRPHNVVFTDASSDILDDGSWAKTFTEPGTHHYQCTLHRGMTGQITVTG